MAQPVVAPLFAAAPLAPAPDAFGDPGAASGREPRSAPAAGPEEDRSPAAPRADEGPREDAPRAARADDGPAVRPLPPAAHRSPVIERRPPATPAPAAPPQDRERAEPEAAAPPAPARAPRALDGPPQAARLAPVALAVARVRPEPASAAWRDAPGEPARAAEKDPVVVVSIGRIEVRAATPAPAPPPVASPRRPPAPSLEEYLQPRRGSR